jgi:hypothetical protein
MDAPPPAPLKLLDRLRRAIRVRHLSRRRGTLLPVAARRGLEEHLGLVKRQHEPDVAAVVGRVVLPYALAAKYPDAGAEWGGSSCFRRLGFVGIRAGVRRRGFICTSRQCRGR